MNVVLHEVERRQGSESGQPFHARNEIVAEVEFGQASQPFQALDASGQKQCNEPAHAQHAQCEQQQRVRKVHGFGTHLIFPSPRGRRCRFSTVSCDNGPVWSGVAGHNTQKS